MVENISEQKANALEIASRHKLSKESTKRFVNFLIEWGKLEDCDWTEDRYYAGEWADRFKNKEEYSSSNGYATMALVKVDGMENAVKRLTAELDDYNGFNKSHEEEARKRIARSFESTMKGFKTVVRKNNTKIISKRKNRKCICKSASRMIGKMPDIKAKRFLW